MGPLRVGPQGHEYGTQRTRVRGLEFRVRGLGCTVALQNLPFSVIHIMISDLSPSKGRLFRVSVGPAEGVQGVWCRRLKGPAVSRLYAQETHQNI